MSGDAITAFLHAMDAAGVRPVDAIADRLVSGGIVRFRADGDKPGRLNGWAVLHLDHPPAGAFGNWRLGAYGTWRADRRSKGRAVRPDHARLRTASRAREHAGHLQAQTRAAAVWEAATPATRHPYADAKAMHLAALRVDGARLLVPMRELVTGALWNLQTIAPDGVKRFLPGARTAGRCWGRGAPGETLALCEGVATAAAIHAATGLCAIAAMSACNLETVARAMRRRWPAAAIVVGADLDDVGIAKAAHAACAVGGMVAHPPHPPGDPPHGWDFDDALRAMGAAAVRRAIVSALPRGEGAA